MSKLSKNQWHDLRSEWEFDPKVSFGFLAAKYGVSKQVICARQKKEIWTRRTNLKDINREAVKHADILTGFVKTDEKVDDNEKADETFPLKSGSRNGGGDRPKIRYSGQAQARNCHS